MVHLVDLESQNVIIMTIPGINHRKLKSAPVIEQQRYQMYSGILLILCVNAGYRSTQKP